MSDYHINIFFMRPHNPRRGVTPMGTEIIISYDQVGDILTIDQCRPYAGQDEDEIDEGVVVRKNQETGQIENLSILYFNSTHVQGRH